MLCQTESLFPHATGNMRISRNEPTNREFGKLSTVPSLPWSCLSLGNAATVCYKRLTSLLSSKRDQLYYKTIAWIRCSLSFSLIRSSIQCIRGACSAGGHASKQLIPPIDLVPMNQAPCNFFTLHLFFFFHFFSELSVLSCSGCFGSL